jgi:GNAT superfamily N-acetyltransferase
MVASAREPGITRFLEAWLGAWDPPGDGFTIVGSERRLRPGWDGLTVPALGVSDGAGRGVVSVPPAFVAEVRAADNLGERLPGLVGLRGYRWSAGVFRWSTEPVDLPDGGEWEPADGPRLPGWLRPFGGDVLVARDPGGAYLAGVGLKRHDPTGIELSVGTEPAVRGQGLARRLVAQATRAVLATGAVAIYLHAPDNVASAHVADAAGFPDHGWHLHALFRP